MKRLVQLAMVAAALLVLSIGGFAAFQPRALSDVQPSAQVSADAMTGPASISPLVGTAAKSVLIVQSTWPWDSTADTDVLTSIGYSYTIVTPATFDGMSAAAVQAYNIVLIPSDQPQSFYDWYALNASRFEQYARNGGYLVFFAAYQSWEPLNVPLPGGVTHRFNGQFDNVIADATDPVVTDALSQNVPLTNSDLVGSYCSHVSFDEGSLPAGAKVIFRAAAPFSGGGGGVAEKEASSNQSSESVSAGYDPVTVRYPLGSGSVFASGNTWEIAYDYGWAFSPKALDDVFLSGGSTSAYDLSFLDDYGRSSLCVNSSTGAYSFTKLLPLPVRTFTGVATVQTNTSLLLYMSKVGFNLVYNKSLHTCTSAVMAGTKAFNLLDRNTLDDPPVSCGAQPEGTQPR